MYPNEVSLHEINALNKNKDKNRYILQYFRTNIVCTL